MFLFIFVHLLLKTKPQTRFINLSPSAAEFVPNFSPVAPASPAFEEDIEQ